MKSDILNRLQICNLKQCRSESSIAVFQGCKLYQSYIGKLIDRLGILVVVVQICFEYGTNGSMIMLV